MDLYNRAAKVFGMVMVAMLLMGLVVGFVPQSVAAANPNPRVLVVGGGPGGIGAGVGAHQAGANVTQVTQSDRLGGQGVDSGVSTLDLGWDFKVNPPQPVESSSGLEARLEAWLAPRVPGGLAGLKECYYGYGICPPPSLLEQAYQALVDAEIAKGGYNLVRLEQPVGCLKTGNTVTGITFRNVVTGATLSYSADVVIDATELGDLMPLCGVGYRLGSGSTDTGINPSDRLQDITWTLVERRYDGGIPANLVLPADPPGYDDYAVKFRQMVYAGNGWTAYHSPKSALEERAFRGVFDPSRPAAVDGSTQAGAAQITLSGVNYANDYPLYVKDVQDPSSAQQAFCGALLESLDFLRYQQKELGMLWSLDTTQGYQNSQFKVAKNCPNIPAEFQPFVDLAPIYPYIREGRMLIGVDTMTVDAIAAQKQANEFSGSALFPITFSDSIAVGGYDFDQHGIGLGAQPMQAPFQVTLGAMIPRDVDGFMAVEKSLSQEEPVEGATREQPITLLTGQAAGTAAGLAAVRSEQPRQVPAVLVQNELTQQGMRIALQQWHDVNQATPGWSGIQLMAARKIMAGDGNGNFGPGAVMTRGQMAIVLARTFGWSFDGSEQGAYNAIKVHGLTTAGSFSDYHTDWSVLKDQVALMLARALGQNPADGAVAQQWLASVGIGLDCGDASCLPSGELRWEAAETLRQVLMYLALHPVQASAPPVDGSAPPCSLTTFKVPDLRAWNEHPDGPILSGWVVDVNNLGPVTADGSNPCPVRLDLYVDGKFYIAIYADLPDHGGADHDFLAKAFGEGHTSIRYEYALPKEVQGHRIEVFAVARDLANEGKTSDYACRAPNSYWNGKGSSPWYPNWCGVTAPKSVPGQPGRGTASAPPPQPKPGPQTTPKLGSQHGEPWGYVDNIVVRDGVYILRAWAFDPDNCQAAVRIQVFQGKDWHGVYVGEGKADLPAEAVIGKQCDGVSAHRVEIPLPPELVKAGGTLSLWAINIGPNGWNSQLQDSPASIEHLLALGAGQ